MADSLAVFNNGKIAQIGTPEDVYAKPRTRFVADFVGSSNVLPPALTHSLGGPQKWASLRPEALRIDANGALQGTVTALRYLGSGHRISVKVGEADIGAILPAGTALPETGSVIRLGFEPAALHVMDEA